MQRRKKLRIIVIICEISKLKYDHETEIESDNLKEVKENKETEKYDMIGNCKVIPRCLRDQKKSEIFIKESLGQEELRRKLRKFEGEYMR